MLNEKRKFFNSGVLRRSQDFIIKTIGKIVNDYEQDYGRFQWYKDFWLDLSKKYTLDIFTLNYDTILNSILPKSAEGYSHDYPSSFNPSLLY